MKKGEKMKILYSFMSFLCAMMWFPAIVMAQYDRPVVALTRLDYIYYNVDNPMSVSVPGLLPQDIVVNIGEEKAFLHRDPDGSNSNDYIIRPKDSVGTVIVHVNEKMAQNKMRNRGMIRFRVVTLPNPTLFLEDTRQGDTISLQKLISRGQIRLKAVLEDLNFSLDEPEVLSFDISRSQGFDLPTEITGGKLPQDVIDFLAKARLDETIYIDNVKVRLPDDRIVTLHAQFPLK